jgi:hypothetical protein
VERIPPISRAGDFKGMNIPLTIMHNGQMQYELQPFLPDDLFFRWENKYCSGSGCDYVIAPRGLSVGEIEYPESSSTIWNPAPPTEIIVPEPLTNFLVLLSLATCIVVQRLTKS